MSTQILCDGCGNELDERQVALSGQRANGLLGGGLPDGEFHLCSICGVIAFHAMVTRTGPVDEHRLVTAYYDALRARKAGAR